MDSSTINVILDKGEYSTGRNTPGDLKYRTLTLEHHETHYDVKFHVKNDIYIFHSLSVKDKFIEEIVNRHFKIIHEAGEYIRDNTNSVYVNSIDCYNSSHEN